MQQTANPSLQELRRETEQTRTGLTQTVDQLKTSVSETASDLRQRISPEAIKAEVADYVRSRGERMIEDITAAARRNPMQAVAVGASIAYPLLRLARAIPLPVLMVGAGVFFASSKAGQSVTQKASDLASDLSDEVRRRSHDLSDQVSSSIDAAKDVASNTVGTCCRHDIGRRGSDPRFSRVRRFRAEFRERPGARWRHIARGRNQYAGWRTKGWHDQPCEFGGRSYAGPRC